MNPLQAFIREVRGVAGVKRYVFLRADGHVVAHDVSDPETVGSAVALSSMLCESAGPLVGGTRRRYILFSRENNESLLVFQVKNYLLGVVKAPDAYGPAVATEVLKVIERASPTGVKPQG